MFAQLRKRVPAAGRKKIDCVRFLRRPKQFKMIAGELFESTRWACMCKKTISHK